MTLTVSEREEGAFLDYILELARRQEASPDIRQEHDETSKDGAGSATTERIAR